MVTLRYAGLTRSEFSGKTRLKNISVIGAGSWGTALSIMAARAGHHVCLWTRNEHVATSINLARVNPTYLSHAVVPEAVRATTRFETALEQAEIVILAAPSQVLRHLLLTMAPHLQRKVIIVSASKGLEVGTGKRISQVVEDTLGYSIARYVCLSGPSFAGEVIDGYPTAVVAAGNDFEAAATVQHSLSFENLRIYTNNDVAGTELGGAVKNVMAIAAGMIAGLGFGSNSVAALITRGLAEISRLALHEGAQRETLMGLAGLGDLVLTCTGSLSRNRYFGERLGQGDSRREIAADMKEVAEGVATTLAVKLLADAANLEMPITNEVKAVLYDGKSARAAVDELMRRPLKHESH